MDRKRAKRARRGLRLRVPPPKVIPVKREKTRAEVRAELRAERDKLRDPGRD
ncbi:MAG TPA: hypothetical protein VNM16_04700 [Bacillota bacterium]|nr:hypothetical protein [Bacillota bacterium]